MLQIGGGAEFEFESDFYRLVGRYPDANDPAIFVLERIGGTDPLVLVRKSVPIRADGTSISVDLMTGRAGQSTNDSITIEFWSRRDKKANPNRNEPYDWRCRITVPNGGLVERASHDQYEPPSDGYQPTDEINMPASLGRAWHSQLTRKYFTRLPDGKYASVDVTITAGGDQFASIQSHLNISGSRNLEFDPRKVLKPGS